MATTVACEACWVPEFTFLTFLITYLGPLATDEASRGAAENFLNLGRPRDRNSDAFDRVSLNL